MSSRISHIPFYDRHTTPDWKLFVAGLLYIIPIGLLYFYKPMLAVLFALTPPLILLISHGATTIYVLTAATFLFLPWDGPVTLLPPDIMAMILAVSYLLDLLCHGKLARPNMIARLFFAYLVVALISIALQGFTMLSVRYFGRQILLFITFAAVAHFGPKLRVKDVLMVYVGVTLLNSLYSLAQFFASGGSLRTFGLAGRGYGDHAVIAFIISAIYFIWSRDIRHRFFWLGASLITIAALAATQTRASVISAGIAGVVILFSTFWAMRHSGDRLPLKNLRLAMILAIFGIPLLAIYTPIFDGILDRFSYIGPTPSETILLRVTIWKAAFAAFIKNPLFGIGVGNYANVAQWVPEVRFDHIFYLVAGRSAHSVFMSVLAEMGIFGIIVVTWFFTRSVRHSWRLFAVSGSYTQVAETQSLFVIALIIAISSIYAGAWFWGSNSYHMALFLGLAATYRHSLPKDVS